MVYCWEGIMKRQSTQSRMKTLQILFCINVLYKILNDARLDSTGPQIIRQLLHKSIVIEPMWSRRYISQFLHSSTMNCWPIIVPVDFKMVSFSRLLNLKSAGFKSVRFPNVYGARASFFFSLTLESFEFPISKSNNNKSRCRVAPDSSSPNSCLSSNQKNDLLKTSCLGFYWVLKK